MDTGADTASPTLTASTQRPRRATGGACRLRGVLRQRLRVRQLGLAHPAGARRARPGPGQRWAWSCSRWRSAPSSPCPSRASSSPASARRAPSSRCRSCWRPASRPSRSATTHGVPPVVVGLFLVGFGNGTWDVAMNVEGAAVEQQPGPLDHVPVPRRLQPRHGRRARCSGSAMVALHVGVDTPPRRRRRGRRGGGADLACAASCPPARRTSTTTHAGLAGTRCGLDRAADPADRAVRPRHGVHRGHRQRLARRRGHRRLRRPGGGRLADVRGRSSRR